MLMEASMHEKKKEQNNDDSIAMGDETVCTVDKEDVEDHGSSSQEEDNNTPDTEFCERMPNDGIEFNNVACNYATAFLPGSSNDDDSDGDYDDDNSFEANMFSPPEAKQMRLAPDQDEVAKLQ